MSEGCFALVIGNGEYDGLRLPDSNIFFKSSLRQLATLLVATPGEQETEPHTDDKESEPKLEGYKTSKEPGSPDGKDKRPPQGKNKKKFRPSLAQRTVYVGLLGIIITLIVGLINANATMRASTLPQELQWTQTAVIGQTATVMVQQLPSATLAPPQPTPTSTWTATPMLTPTQTASPTATPIPSTPTPTLSPHDAVIDLIRKEAQAATSRDISLINAIFAPDAVRVDEKGNSSNAIEWYKNNFNPDNPNRIEFSQITQSDFILTSVDDNTLQVSMDSCGYVKSNGQSSSFCSLHTDRWTFLRKTDAWKAVNLTLNTQTVLPEYRFTFEDGNAGCWAVRYFDGFAQGNDPTYTQDMAHSGSGALKFTFKLADNTTHHAQVAIYNVPFKGKVSGYIYIPPDAPDNLKAGFFVQELSVAPWGIHEATQNVALKPGTWTQVTWNVDTSAWKQTQPLHFLGIDVSQMGPSTYQGYILLDDVIVANQ